jgi:di/tricarboxylate transporter
MTWEIAFMLLLMGAMLVAFLWEKLPAELTAMSGFALLLVVGLLPPEAALGVFANSGPLTVGAMFILSAALERCGALDSIGGRLSSLPKLPLVVVMPVMVLLVATLSAFINNTPVVVVFLPVIIQLARRIEVPASKLLIPLSYASIFGGTCTLVGTSTNIIVSSMAEEAGLPALGMFEIAAVGVPLVIMGTLYLTFLGPRLLPVRETLTSILSEDERREYILEAFIRDDSPLVGKTINDTALRHVRRLRVLEILRHGVRIDGPNRQTALQPGDRLLLALSPSALAKAQQAEGLDLRDSLGEGLEKISLSQGVIVEAVIGPDSSLAGTALASLNFRQRYRMVALAVHRRGENLQRNFDTIPLVPGDTLLLLGTAEGIDQANATGDLLFLNRPPVVLAGKKRKIPLILGVIAGVILVAALEWMPIGPAAMVGCVILLLSKCLSTREAYDSIQWSILFLIFAMLGVGAAMQETGTSTWLAAQLVSLVSSFVEESWQPLALLAGVYLLTAMLTEVLSNNAAAVLIATLAIGLAQSIGVDPRPFLIAVAVAASASFSTPIGYQTNTYVYGVGGYRFSDFTRVGLPLNVLAFLLAMLIIPRVWSF